MHTDQWRFDGYQADALASRWPRALAGMHTADTIAQSARLGWMPFYPQFDTNPLDLADEAEAAVDAGDGRHAGGIRGESPARRQPQPGDRRRRRPGELAADADARRSNLMDSSPRATSTSSSTCSAPTATYGAARTPRRRGRPRT